MFYLFILQLYEFYLCNIFFSKIIGKQITENPEKNSGSYLKYK